MDLGKWESVSSSVIYVTRYGVIAAYKNIKENKKIMWLFVEIYAMMKITKLNKK